MVTHQLQVERRTGKVRRSKTDVLPTVPRNQHIVESCRCHPTKVNGGLSRLHAADEDAVSWLTNIMVYDTHTRSRISYCWTLIGNPTQGIQPLRVTTTWDQSPHFGIPAHLSHYYGLLFDFRQFHVAPQMLSTQCDCHSLLITLIAGLCLQHLTTVRETVSPYCCGLLLDSVYIWQSYR